MALSSGIFRVFKSKFILDEDGLRRIEGVLRKASGTYDTKLVVVYRVEREDARFFETHNVDDVLADPNVDKRHINGLSIELQLGELENLENASPIVHIEFNKDEDRRYILRNVSLQIASPNSTWALLLADELEPQITRLFKAKQIPRWILLPYLAILGVIIYRVSMGLSGDITLAQKSTVIALILVMAFSFMYKLLAQIAGNPGWLARYFGPESVFLFGDEIQSFAEREKIRKNIFWIVLVGFLISLAASMLIV